MQARPFVKWAGGKSQLLSEIRTKYPTKLNKEITRYCEPFVGGGAVLFDVLSNFNLQEILINDINVELINTYIQIKENINELQEALRKLQNIFWELADNERKLFYAQKRERFNYIKINGNKTVDLEKAALFIFLNKTCFNGLFRVNKRGLFNVPMGSYKNPIICDFENLQNIHSLLQKVIIKCGDYKGCLPFINEDSFVYIDPPYRPLSKTASFTSYAEMPFGDNEQAELGQFVDKLHKLGAKVVLSNSDPKNTDGQDNFFDDIYKKYNICRVSAKRMINCKGKSRGTVSELLISN